MTSLTTFITEYNYEQQPLLSGLIDDKVISGSDYHVIIDDKAYTADREEWNKITKGDEVEFKENSLGKIIIEK